MILLLVPPYLRQCIKMLFKISLKRLKCLKHLIHRKNLCTVSYSPTPYTHSLKKLTQREKHQEKDSLVAFQLFFYSRLEEYPLCNVIGKNGEK